MKKKIIKPAAAVILAFGILATSGCKEDGRMYSAANVPTIASAAYPNTAKYPQVGGMYSGEVNEEEYDKWREQETERREAGQELDRLQTSLTDFYGKTINAFLTDSNGENRVYSPVNLYFALAMAAEITDGNSRGEISELLGVKDIETLRKQSELLWKSTYRDDGATTSVLANSVWLNRDIDFKKDALEALAEKYYASSFSGDPKSEEMNTALREWLDVQTGGLLKDAAENIQLDPELIVALCSTVYFRAKWDMVFSENENDFRQFHGSKGDIEKEFMNKTFRYGPYYYGEDFGAIYMRFAEGGGMWIILPDEGKSPDDVLKSGEYLKLICDRENWQGSERVKVNCSLPKFDVGSELDLKKGLEGLGVRRIFDFGKADFSPLSDRGDIAVTEVKQTARVAIDEEGCTAAAYTAMIAAGAAIPPEDEVDFVVDRPFVFAVMGDCEQPLFVGSVYEP